MIGLLHAIAFMVLLLVGWVIWINKPLPLHKNWECAQSTQENFSFLLCSAANFQCSLFPAETLSNAWMLLY